MSENTSEAQGRYKYKCRHCGEIYEDPMIADFTHHYADMLSLIHHNKRFLITSPVASKMMSCHDCGNGITGVSDLVGIVKLEASDELQLYIT